MDTEEFLKLLRTELSKITENPNNAKSCFENIEKSYQNVTESTQDLTGHSSIETVWTIMSVVRVLSSFYNHLEKISKLEKRLNDSNS